MKMFLISDNVDTRIGMRLVGVQGVINHTREEIEKSFDLVLNDPEVAVVLITVNLSSMVSDLIDSIRLNYERPLIVEIPDRHMSRLSDARIAKYIREAVGMSLD